MYGEGWWVLLDLPEAAPGPLIFCLFKREDSLSETSLVYFSPKFKKVLLFVPIAILSFLWDSSAAFCIIASWLPAPLREWFCTFWVTQRLSISLYCSSIFLFYTANSFSISLRSLDKNSFCCLNFSLVTVSCLFSSCAFTRFCLTLPSSSSLWLICSM